MTKLSKREVTLLIILVIALCGALYYNFVLKPYLAKNVTISTKTIEVNKSLNDFKAKSNAILALEANIKAIEDEMAPKFKTVLDSIDRPAIIVMLDKNLQPQATNITLQFSPAYEDLKSNYITTVEASFQCTQEGFKQILSNLKTAAYVNRVIKSSLTIADPNTDSCNASISIEILTVAVLPTGTKLAN